MRIAYLSSGYLPALGGVERHVAELATRMVSDGHQTEVIAPTSDPQLPRWDSIDGVTVRRFAVRSLGGPLALAPGLVAYLAANGKRYDVVHAQNYHALAAPLGALCRTNILVFTPHYLSGGAGGLQRVLHAAYRPLGAVSLRRACRLVCVSHAEEAMLRSDVPRLSTPVAVIPNGIDVAGIRAAEPHRVAGRVILTAGRFEAYKNMETLVQSLPHLDHTYNLLLAGEGRHRPALERLVGDLRLAARVTFTGQLAPRELHRWLRTAHVYVTLSPRECFNIAALEASVAGAPVVASDIPTHVEVLGGSTGVSFVPPGVAPRALAEVIRDRVHSGRSADGAVGARTWDEVAEEHLRLYRSLVRHA
jgi:glycosyltransferase involved in cell wall biosynthesis